MVDAIHKPKLPPKYKPHKDLYFTRLHLDVRGLGYDQSEQGNEILGGCLNARAAKSPDLVPLCREFVKVANEHAEKTGQKRISLLQLVRQLDQVLQEPFMPVPERN